MIFFVKKDFPKKSLKISSSYQILLYHKILPISTFFILFQRVDFFLKDLRCGLLPKSKFSEYSYSRWIMHDLITVRQFRRRCRSSGRKIRENKNSFFFPLRKHTNAYACRLRKIFKSPGALDTPRRMNISVKRPRVYGFSKLRVYIHKYVAASLFASLARSLAPQTIMLRAS